MTASAMASPLPHGTGLADPSTLIQFARFARANGLNLNSILDEELHSILTRCEVADRIPAHGIVDMLQICSATTQRPFLGAEFTMWANLRGYGPLSMMWDQCPNYREAIRINQRYVHLETASLGTRLVPEGDEVALQHLLLVPARFGGSQFLLGTLTLELRVARLILGDSWQPLRLELESGAPGNIRYLNRIFGCPIEFGAERSALIVSKDDLDRPAPGGNVRLLAYLERQLERSERVYQLPFRQRVEQVVAANLTGNRISTAAIAAQFAMSRRTFLRRLAGDGISFGDILMQVRKRAANEYLMREARPCLTELAHVLGYADCTSASRFLRQELGKGLRA